MQIRFHQFEPFLTFIHVKAKLLPIKAYSGTSESRPWRRSQSRRLQAARSAS